MNIRFLLAAAFLSFAAHAQAEVVLVAHPGVGLSSLPQSQVSRLFFGQARQFPNGTAALPLDVSGALKDQFAQQVLKKSPEQVEKYWARMIFTGKAKPPREVKAGDVKAMVASTPGAISYLDRSLVDGSVKVIDITAD
jgi:ABC-type phosphate transport system substrate-binding protein